MHEPEVHDIARRHGLSQGFAQTEEPIVDGFVGRKRVVRRAVRFGSVLSLTTYVCDDDPQHRCRQRELPDPRQVIDGGASMRTALLDEI